MFQRVSVYSLIIFASSVGIVGCGPATPEHTSGSVESTPGGGNSTTGTPNTTPSEVNPAPGPAEGSSGGSGSNCDLYTIFNKTNATTHHPNRASFDAASDDPPATITTEGDGTRVVKLVAGLDSFKTKQVKSMRYLDFDTDTVLAISDKDAIEKNKEWDIGIRGFELYTNGGPYPGDIEVAIARGKGGEYATFSKTDAEGLTYISEEPVDAQCNAIMRGQFGYLLLASAPNQLNMGHGGLFQNNYWFTSNPFPGPGNAHTKPKNDLFILRSKSNKDWIYKFKVEPKVTADKSTKAISYTLRYTKL